VSALTTARSVPAALLPHLDDERPTMPTTPRPSARPPVRSSVRINPDTRPVLSGLLLVLVACAGASFALSFTGLSASAPWAAVPAEMAWLVPVALEVAMLAYVVAAAVRAHRGQRAWLAWMLVWGLTTVSSTINALHAWDEGPRGWQGMVGAGLAAMFPYMTLAAAHVVVGVAFAQLRRRTGGRPDTAPDPLAVLAQIETAPRTDGHPDTDTATDGQADTGRKQRRGRRTDDGRRRTKTLLRGQRRRTPDAGQPTSAPRTDGQPDGQADSTDPATDTGQAANAGRDVEPALRTDAGAAAARSADGQVYDQTTDTAPDTLRDSGQAASAGQADGHAGAGRPGGQSDGHRMRTVRERRADVDVDVDSVRPQVAELARQGMSGRRIAEQLDIGKTRACEIVRELKDSGVLSAA
jgi:hypothetical protein